MIFDCFEGLASGAKTGSPATVREGYVKEVAGSHVIYFLKRDYGVEIVRVLHGRMDVERHL